MDLEIAKDLRPVQYLWIFMFIFTSVLFWITRDSILWLNTTSSRQRSCLPPPKTILGSTDRYVYLILYLVNGNFIILPHPLSRIENNSSSFCLYSIFKKEIVIFFKKTISCEKFCNCSNYHIAFGICNHCFRMIL